MAFRRKPRKKDFEEYLNYSTRHLDEDGKSGTRLRKGNKAQFDKLYNDYLRKKGFET